MLLQVGVFVAAAAADTAALRRARRRAHHRPHHLGDLGVCRRQRGARHRRVPRGARAERHRPRRGRGDRGRRRLHRRHDGGGGAVGDPLASRLRTTAAPAGERGRAVNAGVRLATGEIILVLHADTLLPAGWDYLCAALADPAICSPPSASGATRAARAARRAARRPRVWSGPSTSAPGGCRLATRRWRRRRAPRARRRLPGAPDPRGVRAGEPAAAPPPPAPAASSRWPLRRRCAHRGGGSARRARCGAPTPSTRR